MGDTKKKKQLKMAVIGLLLVGIVAVAVWRFRLGGRLDDGERFAGEYGKVGADNVFVYKTVDQVLELMRSGTGIVYLGYPECGWCQAYVPYLNEAALEKGVREIWYCNTKEVKEKDMDKFYELISLLDGHLQYTDTGEQWIYVPNVSFHVDGKLVGNDYETSKDTHGLTEPEEYWTKEEQEELKGTLSYYMDKVLAAWNGESEAVQVEFYYENVCASCEGDADFYALYNRCISPEEKKGLNVEILTYNVFMDSCKERFRQQSDRLGIPEGTSLPVLIIGDEWLAGYEEMEESLHRILVEDSKTAMR